MEAPDATDWAVTTQEHIPTRTRMWDVLDRYTPNLLNLFEKARFERKASCAPIVSQVGRVTVELDIILHNLVWSSRVSNTGLGDNAKSALGRFSRTKDASGKFNSVSSGKVHLFVWGVCFLIRAER